ncbi:hypothetical protein BGLA2_280062 [Burkholderia gladioli]|nr:hypothetical protein BGLA2_280062 [Burkholderia gladioli]
MWRANRRPKLRRSPNETGFQLQTVQGESFLFRIPMFMTLLRERLRLHPQGCNRGSVPCMEKRHISYPKDPVP